MAMTTIDLLERARNGSDEALGALVERCGPKLLALVRLRLGPSLRREVESRDVLQSALLKAVGGFDRFAGTDGGSLMAWLARIAENEVRDLAEHHGRQRRDAARRVSLEESPEAARLASRVRSQTSLVACGERLSAMTAALESLAADHREVIVLHALQELSFPEVGQRLGRSADACRMLFARAMTALTLAVEDRTAVRPDADAGSAGVRRP
jgi:RNA polymerase sigma-70 factor (ECF subfamily)